MNPAQVFLLANALVFPHWLLMIFAPKLRITIWLSKNYPSSVILAVLYVYYVFNGEAKFKPDSFISLEGIKQLFATGGDTGMLAGWLHYLCFDLVVGCWIFNDAKTRNIMHLYIVPCLFFTFMLGPLGFLLYVLLRKLVAGQV